ncbi:reverse transcriptase domain-containing protein [Tanacetum coccineum]
MSNINVVADKASDALKNKPAGKGKKPVVGKDKDKPKNIAPDVVKEKFNPNPKQKVISSKILVLRLSKQKENPEFKANVNVKRKMILSKEDDRKKKLKGKSKKYVSDSELETDVVDYSSEEADRKKKKLKIKAGLKRKRSGSDSSELDTKNIKRMMNANEINEKKPKLKNLPHLEYAYFHGDKSFPIIISSKLSEKEKISLLHVLEKRKGAIAWKMSDIKGISLSYCTHKILMEDDYKPVIQPQRRLNLKVHDVVKNEIMKLLVSGLIYPILDTLWVSPIHVVPKKGGMIVVLNDKNELIPSRTVTGWRVCIDYRFFQKPIASEDQEKTTFTCPYGTYRRMPFGLCNAPTTFQRCMTAIFHDMVEDFMEVFMADFSVFGAENLAADHLSRLENPDLGTFTEEEITDEFLDEHLMILKAELNNDEPWYADYVNYIVGNIVPPNWIPKKRRRFFSQVKNYFWDELYAFKLCSDNVMRRCVSGNEILEILGHCHSGLTGGHHSASITRRKVYESGFYWPSIFKDAKDYVMRYDACQRSGNISSRSEMPQNNIQVCDVFDIWGLDFMGPFSNLKGDKYILVAVDYVSKWVEAQALPTNNARVVIRFLRRLFARFGVPKALISDRGTHFCNSQLEKALQKYGVTHKLSIAYHPQTNRQTEVTNRAIKHILERSVGYNLKNWPEMLNDALWAFRTAYKTPTGCTPFRLVYGKACHLLLRDEAYENTRIYKERTKRWHDSRLRGDKDFKERDKVLLFNSRFKMHPGKIKSKWYGPNVVKTVHPYGTVGIIDKNGIRFKVNRQRLKKYHDGLINEEEKEVVELDGDLSRVKGS